MEVTDTLGDKLQTLEDMVLAVSTMAEEAVAKLAKDMEDQKSDQWSDWDILEYQGCQTLQSRVTELEARDPPVTAAEVQELWYGSGNLVGLPRSTGAPPEDRPEVQKKLDELLKRVADLEGQGPFGYVGGVPRQTRADKGRGGVSVMDS